MPTSSSAFVSQKQLADEIGVTPRRVRQLVKEKIFPESTNHGYDLEKCLDRYGLYSSGSETAWNRHFDKLEADALIAEKLIRKATAPSGTESDLENAADAVEDLFADMRFITAVKSSSPAERAFHMMVWDREERRVMGQLAWRFCELIGAKTGRSADEVRQAIATAAT